MDAIGTVIIAIGAFALLQVAAVNLRGDQRQIRSPRSTRPGGPRR
ncbi:MAG TPA: hypothetical protein VD763_13245 [Candidatus Saccharimonadales bacterium]|nr:hypothetical protein [Candidatus Saccharimonadales bacterium]